MLAIWAAAAATAADCECDEDCLDDLWLEPREDVPEKREFE